MILNAIHAPSSPLDCGRKEPFSMPTGERGSANATLADFDGRWKVLKFDGDSNSLYSWMGFGARMITFFMSTNAVNNNFFEFISDGPRFCMMDYMLGQLRGVQGPFVLGKSRGYVWKAGDFDNVLRGVPSIHEGENGSKRLIFPVRPVVGLERIFFEFELLDERNAVIRLQKAVIGQSFGGGGGGGWKSGASTAATAAAAAAAATSTAKAAGGEPGGTMQWEIKATMALRKFAECGYDPYAVATFRRSVLTMDSLLPDLRSRISADRNHLFYSLRGRWQAKLGECDKEGLQSFAEYAKSIFGFTVTASQLARMQAQLKFDIRLTREFHILNNNHHHLLHSN